MFPNPNPVNMLGEKRLMKEVYKLGLLIPMALRIDIDDFFSIIRMKITITELKLATIIKIAPRR